MIPARTIHIDARALQASWDAEASRQRFATLRGQVRALATTTGPGGGTVITGAALVLLGWVAILGTLALIGGAA